MAGQGKDIIIFTLSRAWPGKIWRGKIRRGMAWLGRARRGGVCHDQMGLGMVRLARAGIYKYKEVKWSE